MLANTFDVRRAAAREAAERKAIAKRGDKREGDFRGRLEYMRAKRAWDRGRKIAEEGSGLNWVERGRHERLPRFRDREREKFAIPQLEDPQLSRAHLTRAEWIGAKNDIYRLSRKDESAIKQAIRDRVPPGQFEDKAGYKSARRLRLLRRPQ